MTHNEESKLVFMYKSSYRRATVVAKSTSMAICSSLERSRVCAVAKGRTIKRTTETIVKCLSVEPEVGRRNLKFGRPDNDDIYNSAMQTEGRMTEVLPTHGSALGRA